MTSGLASIPLAASDSPPRRWRGPASRRPRGMLCRACSLCAPAWGSPRAAPPRASRSLTRVLAESRRRGRSHSASVHGRNSWSGGSRSLMVTGWPSIASRMPSKSSRWNGSSFASASRRSVSSSAMIMARMCLMRSSPKNMCSVRQRPMPSAPKLLALAASSGVSAFVRTPSCRNSSAHSMMVAKLPESSGSTVGTWPRMTSPVEPSRVSQSPSLTTVPLTLNVLDA